MTSSAAGTRARILDAALDAFADQSFAGATMRDIAASAGVSQPSVSYHFRSKDELWKATVDDVFARLDIALRARLDGLRGVDEITIAKLLLREFILYSAANPQLHRIITQESKAEGERFEWLIDHHIRPLYEATTTMFRDLRELGVVIDVPAPYLYYILTGAGPTIFLLAPECRRLAGFDPLSQRAVETHADAVIGLLFGSS